MSFIINSYAFATALPFEFVVKTDNNGTSASNQYKLPLVSTGTYNFDVDWGDSTQDTITTWNQAETTHTYASAGTYTIKITGTITGYQHAGGQDPQKLLEVKSFGPWIGASNGYWFNECLFCEFTANDTPAMTGVTSMEQAFRECQSAKNNLGTFLDNLDVSNVTNFNLCFINWGYGTNYGMDLSGWDVSSGTTFANMFQGTRVSVASIGDISGWTLKPTANNINLAYMFYACQNMDQDFSAWDIVRCNDINNMFQSTTLADGTTAKSVEGWDVSNVISLVGLFNSTDLKNSDLSAWTFKTTGNVDVAAMFLSCPNFNDSGIATWNTERFSRTAQMFQYCTNFNVDISSWDMSNNTDAASMFSGCTSFNQDLSGWNTSSLINMYETFRDCLAMTYSLNGWDTSNVTTMERCFSTNNPSGTSGYNANLDLLDTSSVTTFRQCFQYNTVFNGDITTWDTSAAVGNGLEYMFDGAKAFNQDISGFDVTGITSLAGTFSNAIVFDQDLSLWNITGVTNLSQTFQYAYAFGTGGGGLSGWDVSAVTNFYYTFLECTNFNDNIGSWDMTAANTVEGMFYDADGFDQDIGAWELGACTNFQLFMSNKDDLDFTPANLDAIYNGWTNVELQTARTISFGTCKYTAAGQEGRDLLTRTAATVNVSNAVDNGSGLIRITTSANHGRATGDKVYIKNVGGTVEANGAWTVTNVSATEIDLDGSTFTNTYTSGGTVRTGYGWTVTDDGI